jgi:16S rRNA (cytosine967-C5)-methyltransferase
VDRASPAQRSSGTKTPLALRLNYMTASPARRTAFQVLLRVESERAYASDLLHAKLGDGPSRADAALATELTMGVLRWQGLLDFLLQRHLDRPSERLDAEVLVALRIGLYQMRFLDRIPARAAVSESVELAKAARKRSAAPLVNAVLRKLAPQARLTGAKLDALIPSGTSQAQRMAILHSHPAWLVERWIARFGSEQTAALLDANNLPPRVCCAVMDPDQLPEVSDSLREEGFDVTPGRWLRSTLAISGGNPAAAEAQRSGKISVQDEASQMVARLLDARPGDMVLDLCAAPGGKAGILARAVTPTGRVIAADVHEHRLRTARAQLTRTRTGAVSWLALDATLPLPFSESFQRILLDAPCSGTGTLARNPEIRWRLQPDDLACAHDRQVAMLRRALEQLGRGGRLVYATCSMEPEENETVVREVLSQESGVGIVRAEEALRPWLRSDAAAASLFDPEGFFRTFPPHSGTDGFFAAVLERSQ